MSENDSSKISIGELGDVVDIDVSLIGAVRGFKIMQRIEGEKTPSYFSDIILIAAEGYSTPHEISEEWLEKNVSFSKAHEVCDAIVNRTTGKNTHSPAKST